MNGASIGYILGSGAMMFAFGYLFMSPFLFGKARAYRKTVGLPIAFILTFLMAYATAGPETALLVWIAWAIAFTLLSWRIAKSK